MAEVYDTVKGVKGGTVSHVLENGDRKQSVRNSVERVMGMHEDVQRALIKEGMKIKQRAQFSLSARQARHVFRLKEELAEAIKSGDPDWIKKAQGDLNYYLANRTEVITAQADIDFHVMLYRPDGREFFVEVDGDGDRGVEALKGALRG